MSSWRREGRLGRGLALALAILALAIQVLIPPGFMIDGGAGRPGDEAGFLVICTGHGPISALLDTGSPKTPAHKGKAGASCPFAGHAGAAPLVHGGPAIAAAWRPAEAADPGMSDQIAVGRGLAAPPPPARGPPLALA